MRLKISITLFNFFNLSSIIINTLTNLISLFNFQRYYIALIRLKNAGQNFPTKVVNNVILSFRCPCKKSARRKARKAAKLFKP